MIRRLESSTTPSPFTWPTADTYESDWVVARLQAIAAFVRVVVLKLTPNTRTVPLAQLTESTGPTTNSGADPEVAGAERRIAAAENMATRNHKSLIALGNMSLSLFRR